MNKNKMNAIALTFLGLPALALSFSAHAQSDCETQFDACDKLVGNCDFDDDDCWDKGLACYDEVDESCDPFDLDGEDDGDFDELPEDAFDPEIEKHLVACEQAYEQCIAAGTEQATCEEQEIECTWGDPAESFDLLEIGFGSRSLTRNA